MKKSKYILFAVVLIALAAINARVAISNRAAYKKSSTMRMTRMNNERLIIKYVYDDFGNRIRREVVLVPDYSRSQSAASEISEPDKVPETPEAPEDTPPEISVKAYPNPNQGMFWVSISGIDLPPDARIEIFTTTGSLVVSQKITSLPCAVDISNRSTGVYLLRITFGKGHEYVWRIVKN